jgi:hypothetical protein
VGCGADGGLKWVRKGRRRKVSGERNRGKKRKNANKTNYSPLKQLLVDKPKFYVITQLKCQYLSTVKMPGCKIVL